MARRILYAVCFFYVCLSACNNGFLSMAMMSKRKRPYDPTHLPPATRLLRNVEDMFRNNDVSAERTQEICNDAYGAGVTAFRRHFRPRAKAKGRNTNAARDLKNTMLKRCAWPEPYYAKVRVLNKRTHQQEVQWLAFCLPHEYVDSLFQFGDHTVLMGTANMDKFTKKHLDFCQTQANCSLLGLGIWADGVPCNWDRSETIETVSVNLPGLPDQYKALRLPVTGLSKRQVIPETWEDIFKVVAWSFQQMSLGVHPPNRHDGADFLGKSDAKRKKRAGKTFQKACLVEVRGDWDLFANVFHFPRWNHLSGCCWRCNIKPHEVQQVGTDAAWRTDRLTHFGLMARILANGCNISAIFLIPWIDASIFRIDWLHCADIGCIADWMGNFLLLCARKMPGTNHTERVAELWRRTTSNQT